MVILKGKLISDVPRSFTSRGELKKVRELALNSGNSLDNEIVEVPVDYVLPKKDVNGDIEIPFAKAQSKTWSSVSNSFVFNRVRFFVEK